MLNLSAKRSRSLDWWEDPIWETFSETIQRTDYSVWFIGWVLPKNCEGPVKNPSIWKEYLTWIVPRIRSVRGENLDGWHVGCGHWGVGNVGRIKRLDAKEAIFPKENGKFIFPAADGRITHSGRDQELRTSTLIRERPIRGESHIDFLGESEGSLSPPNDSFPDAGHVRKLHIPPSRWTKSQTSLAERGIIPYSTEIHWWIQNYSYKLGCYARTPHRRLLEHRWVKKFVWFLDRFHSVYSIGRETSRRIYVVRVEINEKTADIQARSFLARTLGKMGRNVKLKGRQKWSHEKPQLDNARKLRGIYFIDLEDKEFTETIKNARKKLDANGSCYALQRNQERKAWSDPWQIQWDQIKTCVYFESQWIHKTASGRIFTESSWEQYSREGGQFTTTLWFGSQIYSYASKPWRFPQQRQQWIKERKIGEHFRRGTWRKSDVRSDRWSKDVGRYSSSRLTDGHMSFEKCWIGGKAT